MQFCTPHWEELKQAIADRGMGTLIAKNSEDVFKKLVSQTEDGGKKTNFEPLMAAHNMILQNAMRMVGLEIMGTNEDGTDICPICYLLKQCTCGQEICGITTWIGHAADDTKEVALKLNLIGAG